MRRHHTTKGPEESRVMNALSFPHQITGWLFDAGSSYEKFCGRYEAAVPQAVLRWMGGCAGRHASAGAASACYFNLSLRNLSLRPARRA